MSISRRCALWHPFGSKSFFPSPSSIFIPIESRPCERMMNLRQSSSLGVSPRTNSYEMNFIWQMCERIDHHADDAEPKDEQHVRLTQPTSEWIYPRVHRGPASKQIVSDFIDRNWKWNFQSFANRQRTTNDSSSTNGGEERERQTENLSPIVHVTSVFIQSFIRRRRCRDLMFLSHLDRMEIHL